LGPPGALDRTNNLLSSLSETSGAVRDFDVALQLVPSVVASARGKTGAMEHLTAARPAALAKLQRLLESSRYESAIRRCDSTLERFSRLTLSGPRTTDLATQGYAARELRRLARVLESDLFAPGAYHAVRRRSRRVRDVAEVFGPSLRKGQRTWRKRLQPLQSALGRLNDLDVALTLLPASESSLDRARLEMRRRRYELLSEIAAPLAVTAVFVSQLRR
jgi:CHAD domain-containing protein